MSAATATAPAAPATKANEGNEGNGGDRAIGRSGSELGLIARRKWETGLKESNNPNSDPISTLTPQNFNC